MTSQTPRTWVGTCARTMGGPPLFMLSQRYFKVAMSRSIRSLETISRPYRHFVFVFRVSVPPFEYARSNVSLLPASSFPSSFLSPSFVLQKQDSCRPPISRTRISPLRIFNFNIFLHRAAFTSRYIIKALLLFPALSGRAKEVRGRSPHVPRLSRFST